MAQLDGRHRHSDSPKTPRQGVSPTFEQLLQGDGARWATSPSSPIGHEHDQEGHGHHHHGKKSVLTKVREKAKKLKNSLSRKKHDHDDGIVTPTSTGGGVSLERDEVDEDPEYFGAPMYESEMAPEGCKEAARQHPRVVPVVSEKHVLPTSVKHEIENETDKKPSLPNKTITETVTEKLGPAYAAVSDATQTIASKIAGLTIANHAAQDTADYAGRGGMKDLKTASSESREEASTGQQTWDKGISVKEYLMQKLEPGDGERALSQVITEAMSPRKTPTDMGIVGKVRDAVSTMLSTEESSHSTALPTTSSYPIPIPISTNAHEVVEEEHQGRILQSN